MITDTRPNQIVSYSINSTKHTNIVVDPIKHAIQRRGDITDCTQITQTSLARRRSPGLCLRRHNIVGSIGRLRSATDNAAMKSF
ncbi:MAG: hypothetical protein B5766_09905 [Candidatus Lumbricidophila eiseniae]|uniref:Uncharacterized protein n=1 Tax=Candidatus Lumbricidiphila eiseniae TaxID=1969409 RepID=A0A2A6FQS2_9MICO|nr:MAG: hypothetical protein B5766_09905 [Candidatus Lumbricidophila eiseniae]